MPIDSVESILQKVAYFQKVSLVRPNLQLGEFRSRRKRGGIGEIEQIRPYVYGDEVRFIDRNVTARTGVHHVRVYREELGLDLLLLQDISSSMEFGIRSKKDVAIEVIAALVTASQSNIGKIDLVPFSDRVEQKFSQFNTNHSTASVIQYALQIPSKTVGTNLSQALEYVQRTQKRRSLICIISDFILIHFPTQQLAALSKKHSIFAIHVLDPLEIALPESGWTRFRDPEKRQEIVWNLGNPKKRKYMESFLQKKLLQIKDNICQSKAEYLQLVTSQNYLQKLWIYLSSSRRLK